MALGLFDPGSGVFNGTDNMGLSAIFAQKYSFKYNFRWYFYIPSITTKGINMMPPKKSGRPTLTFKEIECKHLIEDIFFPGKPEWSPIEVVLYDNPCAKSENGTVGNPLLDWFRELYNSNLVSYNFIDNDQRDDTKTFYSSSQELGYCYPANPDIRIPGHQTDLANKQFYKRYCVMVMFSPCGDPLESMIFDNAYPSKINWGNLDYDDETITTISMTLRYDRVRIF